MKQICLTLLLALLSILGAQAYDAYIDGIYYNFNGTEATVTFGDNKYTGDIVIPGSVMYNDTEYSVTCIGIYAFIECRSLTSITIPNSVVSIGPYAFAGCSGLTSISIPNSVVSIENYALRACSGLTSITIPNSVTSIGDGAFCECTGLTSITIPNSVTFIGGVYIFYDCTNLTTIVVEEGNTKYDSRNNCNAIIETSSNTLIVGCNNSTIPNSVTTIGSGAFQHCNGLASITIPNSVTSIRDNAFWNCFNLTNFTVDDGNTVYASEDGVLFNKAKTSILQYPQAKSETAYVIPNSVTSIGVAAFMNCSNLTSITIPNSVTSIENSAFCYCISLTSIMIPNGVTSIGWCTFLNCSSLKNVSIGNSVTTIGSFAFSGCTGLTSITIPNSVTSIGESAFYECTGLTSITIPNSVTTIGYSAFEGCTGLTSITIPNSVTTIGRWAFYRCTGLTAAILPNSLTSIGDGAFCGCTNLTYIRSEINVPFEIDEDVFTYYENGEGKTIDATLYVPAGTKSAYEAISGWNQLKIEEVVLYSSSICSREDEQVELPIMLSNAEYGENVVGVSFTLQLPEGVSVALDEDGDPVWSFVSERVNKKQFSVVPAQYDDGTWGFRVYTTSGTGVIKGTEGAFMNILLNVADGMADGAYAIRLKDNKLSVKDESNNVTSVNLPDITSTLTIKNYKQGDVNDDGEIDLSDAIMVTYYSLHIEPSGFIRKVADMNSDDEIDLSDAILIIYKSLGVLPIQSMPLTGDALYAINYLQSRRAAAAQESISVDNISLKAGEEAMLDINYQLPDDGIYVGFMFKVELPEGLSLVEDPDDPDYPWYDDEVTAISKMSITTTTTGGFAATPKTGSSTIKGNSGVLMRLKVRAAENLTPGNYTARLTDLSFNLRDENYNVTKSKLDDVPFDVAVTDGNEGLKGDVNGDGAVDIADVVAVYNIMAGNNQSGYNGDVNKDGATDIADVVAIYNIMAGGK